MIYLLAVKEILILSNNIYLFTKSILYSDTKLYSFQGTVSVRSRKYILVQRNIFILGNYSPFKKIYLFKEHIFVQVQATCSFKKFIFIKHCCIRGIAEIFIQKLSPATL